jgi:hypothetical protein
MKILDRFSDAMCSSEWWLKVLVLTFLNFFVFIIAGLCYFIPIDLTWMIIGKAPAILLGATSLWVYSMIFASFLVTGITTCPKCGKEKDE